MSEFTIEDIYPLTPMQQGMLFHGQLSDDALLYAEQISCFINGDLKFDYFRQAWEHIIARYSCLRTLYVLDDEDALQLVTRGFPISWLQLDWQDVPAAQLENKLVELKLQDLQQTFDLSSEPPLRLTLVKVAPERCFFIWRYHHVVHDGWSIPLVFNDVQLAYHALVQGQRPLLAPVTSYAKYMEWLAERDQKQAAQFWQEYLTGFEQANQCYQPLPGPHETRSCLVTLPVNQQDLSAAAQHLAVTPNCFFQLAWAILLSQLSGDKDIVFGATTSGRPPELPGVDTVVGLFINSLPVRVKLAQPLTVAQMLRQLMKEQLQARQYEFFPLADIQQNSSIAAGSALFNTLLVFENYPDESSLNHQGADIQLDHFEMFGRNDFPLSLIVIPGRQMQLKISYQVPLINQQLITLLPEYLTGLLTALIDKPDAPLHHIRVVPAQMAWLKGTQVDEPTQTVVAMFTGVVGKFADRPALIDPQGQLTYQQLHSLVDELAMRLIAYGVQAGSLVGLHLPRGRQLVAAMLAVMKLGAAYIGLPLNTPVGRINAMLRHAKASTLLTDMPANHNDFDDQLCILPSALLFAQELQSINSDCGLLLPDQSDPAAVAYIAYTSGSTGEPKGIMASHRSVANYLRFIVSQYQLNHTDITLQVANSNFDASVRDTLAPLCAGACVVLSRDEEAKDAGMMLQLIDRHQITAVLSLVPSMLRVFPQVYTAEALHSIRLLLVSGEVLHGSVVAQTQALFGLQCQIVNQYGPTECAMTSMFHYAVPAEGDTVSIGRPIDNAEVLVLDEQMQLVAAGCTGEVYIGGPGLAYGYLGAGDLTAAAFVPHPLSQQAGARLYRTGDLARVGFDRHYQLLGRKDSLVKLRGRRVELTAIEAQLSNIAGVLESALIMHQQGDSELLVAWLVLTSQTSEAQVAKTLGELLPEYMLPDQWQLLDSLPKTPNGKTDRRALQARPLFQATGSDTDANDFYLSSLLEIFSAVLARDDIGSNDNFFALGGTSLHAITAIGRIRKVLNCQLQLKQLFDTPTAKRLAQHLQQSSGLSLLPALVSGNVTTSYPLSDVQQRMWFLQQMAPLSSAYHIPVAFQLTGKFQLEHWRLAVQQVINRHDILRTCYVEDPDGVVAVLTEQQLQLQWHQLPVDRLQTDDECHIRQWLNELFNEPFDLATDLPLRCGVMSLGEDRYVLAVCLHHICADLWSLRLLLAEVLRIYQQHTAGTPVDLQRDALQYQDYAAWHNQVVQLAPYQQQLAFWHDYLADAPQQHNVPVDYLRPAISSNQGQTYRQMLSAELFAAIGQQCNEYGVTLYMYLQSAFALYLSGLSGDDDIVMGTPIANRELAETHRMLGCFVNTLVLRSNIDLQLSFAELLASNKTVLLEVFSRQLVAFETLVDDLVDVRDLSRNPLFQIFFAVNKQHEQAPAVTDFTLSRIERDDGHAKFDLSLTVNSLADGAEATWQYSTDLFKAETVRQMAASFVELLQQLVDSAETPMGQLNLVNAKQRQILLEQFNATDKPGVLSGNVQQLFSQQAALTPTAVAAYCGDCQISYGELELRSNQLANFLIAKGVRPQDRVGICQSRGIDMIMSVLAILKAGAAYVPLDPNYPPERLHYLQQDAALGVVLTQHVHQEKLAMSAQLVCLDDPVCCELLAAQQSTAPEVEVSAHHIAHLIYTSGSTGNPKGVLIRQSAVLALVEWANTCYADEDIRCVLASTSLNFDLSVYEIWSALTRGGSLLIVNDVLDLAGDVALAPTLINTVPSAAQALLDAALIPASVQVINLAGEALPMKLVNGLFAHSKVQRIYNLYGPSEDTTYSTAACFTGPVAVEPAIGRPIDRTKAYILDRCLRPVPIGTSGELYLAGAGLSDGYHQRPDLTAASFIPDPFASDPGQRLYRTGDKVRWLANGDIEYLGRFDFQVKIRGFRIELAEVEFILSQQATVKTALVTVREDHAGRAKIVAYVVLQQDVLDQDAPDAVHHLAGQLKGQLKTLLPAYMVPDVVMILARFPLTPNGKVDRKALPTPQFGSEQYVAAANTAEQQMAGLWSQVLKQEPISVTDNFFELGGDSILSILLVSKAKKLGYQLTPKQLFEYQTIRELVPHLVKVAGNLAPQRAVSGSQLLLPIQQDFFTDRTAISHFNQAVLLTTPASFTAQTLTSLAERLYLQHDVLRLRFSLTEPAVTARYQAYSAVMLTEVTEIITLAEDGFSQVTAHAQRIQESLNIEHGPLFKVVWLRSAGHDCGRLLLVVHHLAIDGVSWRILAEQAEQWCRDDASGQQITFAKSSSYQQWAEYLADYANSAAVTAQQALWTQMLQNSVPLAIPEQSLEHAVGQLAETSGVKEQSCSIDSHTTQLLLQEACKAYRTRITELLLAAVLRALQQWNGQQQLRIDIESHGREEAASGLDLSSTVGWFTTIYPLTMTLDDIAWPALISKVKATCRTIPDNGIGFGLLQHLATDQSIAVLAASHQSDVLFNYLGQFDQSVQQDGYFAAATEDCGDNIAPNRAPSHGLMISGRVFNGQLDFTLRYAAERFSSKGITLLLEALTNAVQELVVHCTTPGVGQLVPADFELADITEVELNRWQSEYQIDDIYPATDMQQGLLFHSAMEQGAYVTQNMQTLEGELDTDAFIAAWQWVVQQHAIFRTVFVGQSGQLQQLVNRSAVLPYLLFDLRQVTESEQLSQIEQYRQDDKRKGFVLHQAPLMRLAIWRLQDQCHRVLWTHHHALLDGWCLPLVFSQVLTAYLAVRSGNVLQATIGRPYRDYVAWLAQQDRKAAEDYWRKQLAGIEGAASLPVSNVDSSRQGVAELHFALDLAQTAELIALAKRHNTTVNILLQSAWSYLLARYTGQSRVTFGTTVSGRPAVLEGVEQMVGLFINTVPVSVEVPLQMSMASWFAQMHRELLERDEYSYLPLSDIQRLAQLPSGSKLFDSLLVFENYPVDQTLAAAADNIGLSARDIRNFEGTNYPLTLTVSVADQARFRVFYQRHLYSEKAMAALQGHLLQILQGMVTAADPRVGRLPVLDEPQQHYLIYQLNDTARPYPEQVCLHQLFETNARQTPDAVAVLSGDECLTYRQLNQQANRLARYMIAQGVRVGDLIPVSIPRRSDMIVALMAVLKTGAAYVPMDPVFPAQRKNLLIERVKAPLVLTHSQVSDELSTQFAALVTVDQINLSCYQDDDLGLEIDATTLAYIIFTSGSTGEPKGVMLQHKPVVNLINWVNTRYQVNAADRVLFITSMSFDLSVYDIFGLLAAGGSIYMATEADSKDPLKLVELIQTKQITFWDSAPAALMQLVGFLPEQGSASLRLAFLSGDWIPLSLPPSMQHCYPNVQVVGLGGATEAAIWSNFFDIQTVEAHWRSIPYGLPIQNARYYVLNENLDSVPDGVTGDLYIGGQCLSYGYYNQPMLTAERYLPDPHASQPGGVLYNTGDRARRMDDGQLEFMGRVDHQVKLRGYRIELGEIEAAINSQSSVKESIVMIRHDNAHQSLVAYCFMHDGQQLDVSALAAVLRRTLPDYMVPAYFMPIDCWPVTANGKLDRAALPKPDICHDVSIYEAPEGELECQLAHLWQQLLHVPVIGRNDNFFTLGGHSLLVVQVCAHLRSVYQVDVPVRWLFDAPNIADFAAKLSSLMQQSGALPTLTLADRQTTLPLSFAQQRLWFISQLEGRSNGYNIAWSIQIDGALDVACFEQAMQQVIARHEVFRLGFIDQDGVAQVVLHPRCPFRLSLTTANAADVAELTMLRRQHAEQVFDLSQPPLISARLLLLGPHLSELQLNIHHIISDGWSMGILVREFAQAYQALVDGKPLQLPALPYQYLDFASWQREVMTSTGFDERLASWAASLASFPQQLELATDRSYPVHQSYDGQVVHFEFNAEIAGQLRTVAATHNVTLYMVLLSAFELLLYSQSGQDRFLVGSPCSGRPFSELEAVVGFFINNLVLPCDLSDSPDFASLLDSNRQRVLTAFEYQDIPFEMLVDKLNVERNTSRPPLIQALFTLQSMNFGEIPVEQLQFAMVENEHANAIFELMLTFNETSQGLKGALQYSTALFDQVTIENMVRRLQQMVSTICQSPQAAFAELTALSGIEIEHLMQLSGRDQVRPVSGTLLQYYEQQVQCLPAYPAVHTEQKSLTYAELDRQANQLAHYLASLGIGYGDKVSLCMPRCADMIVSMLAVVKLGAAYVPLDPAYPVERFTHVLVNADAKALLVNEQTRERVGQLNHSVIGIDLSTLTATLAACPTQPVVAPALCGDDLAMIIYTSGSTGLPKGVMLCHQSLVSMLEHERENLAIQTGDRYLHVCSFGFDLGNASVFLPLSFGATLYLVEPTATLVEQMEQFEITHTMFPTGLLAAQIEERAYNLSKLKVVSFGGEAVVSSIIERWKDRCKLINVYGPCEGTIWTTCNHITQADDLSIGYPMINDRCYVLNGHGELLPEGAIGELYIGGTGVARGYHNQPQMTAERFIADPYSQEPGARMYRTGDLVRWRPDGRLSFIGRVDHQVKLRGFRIELGEVENALIALPEVHDATVILDETEQGNRRLVAYVVPANGAVQVVAATLNGRLSHRLPTYMLPTIYVALAALPLNSHGKVDRQALPKAPAVAVIASPGQQVFNEVESQLAQLWLEVLKENVSQLSLQDNFFNCGGHSLAAAQLIARIRMVFQVEMPLKAVFSHSQLGAMAAAITQLSATSQLPLQALARQPLMAASYAQQRLWMVDKINGSSTAYHIRGAFRFRGKLEVTCLVQAFDLLMQRHEVLRCALVQQGEQVFMSFPSSVTMPVKVYHEPVDVDYCRQELETLGRQAIALDQGPLWRAELFTLATDDYWLNLMVHHIISDAWSMTIMMEDLAAIYQALVAGEAPSLPVLPLQYADYAHWQQQRLTTEIQQAQLAYWQQQLKGIPSVHNLPLDKPRSNESNKVARKVHFALSSKTSLLLRELARSQDATLYMVLLAAYVTLISRLSGSEDIVVGSSVGDRPDMRLERVVGFFTNTVALRLQTAAQATFTDVIQLCKVAILDAKAQQDIPFENIVNALELPRLPNVSPVFQLFFVLNNTPVSQSEQQLSIENIEAEQSQVMFELILAMTDSGRALSGCFAYDTGIFSELTITQMVKRYIRLLELVAVAPSSPVAGLTLNDQVVVPKMTRAQRQ